MADDEEDLYDDEFDFVDDDDLDGDFDESAEDLDDDDDGDSSDEDEEVAAPKKKTAKKAAKKTAKKAPKRKAAPKKKKTKAKRKPAAEPVDEASEDSEPQDLDTVEIEQPVEATAEADAAAADDSLDEFGRPKPVANYVVHVYEHGQLKRTIDRDFTPEDAEAFATDYCRTAKPYGRSAVAGKKDAEPARSL